MTTAAIKMLQEMLEQYRHGFRGLPTYDELQAIVSMEEDKPGPAVVIASGSKTLVLSDEDGGAA